jgi:hypothetical protein
MNIQGLPSIDGGIKNVAEKKPARTTPVDSPNASDTVALSVGGDSVERVDSQYIVSADFPVRSEVVRGAMERVSQKDYDKPEVQENVAVSIIDSLGGTESSGKASAPESVSNSAERLQSVQAQASEGYYNRPEVMHAIAEQLINSQGLTVLYGR